MGTTKRRRRRGKRRRTTPWRGPRSRKRRRDTTRPRGLRRTVVAIRSRFVCRTRGVVSGRRLGESIIRLMPAARSSDVRTLRPGAVTVPRPASPQSEALHRNLSLEAGRVLIVTRGSAEPDRLALDAIGRASPSPTHRISPVCRRPQVLMPGHLPPRTRWEDRSLMARGAVLGTPFCRHIPAG
jgi:hypothetical protein